MSVLATKGRLLLVDPSGRELTRFGSLLSHITGNEVTRRYCSTQSSVDGFCDSQGPERAFPKILICERVEALSAKEQSRLAVLLSEKQNNDVLFIGLVDSRSEVEGLVEELRAALTAVVDLPALNFDKLQEELVVSLPRNQGNFPDSLKVEWGVRTKSAKSSQDLPELTKLISSLAQWIAKVESESVMSPPSIGALQKQKLTLEKFREFMGQPGDISSTGDLQVELHVWLLAHHLRRIEVGGKTNVGIVNAAFKRVNGMSSSWPSIEPDLAEAIECCRLISQYLTQEVIGRGEGDSGDGPDIGENKRGIGTMRLILTALFSQGHILFEDYPGTGKSFMVEKLSECISDDIIEEGIDIRAFRRIQCVPDLMPSDITGFEALSGNGMAFRPGPVFAYFVLLDEINRTTPKVQSSLLEAMAEKRVSVGNHRYDLGCVFFVLATQNPLDNVGTYELPAAQLDRFIFKRRLSPVSDAAFLEIVFKDKVKKLAPPRIPISKLSKAIETVREYGKKPEVLNAEVISPLIQHICNIIEEYIKGGKDALDRPIDEKKRLKEGSKPSPRSAQKLIGALKALAFIESVENGGNGGFCITQEHLKKIGPDYFAHRIFPKDEQMDLKAKSDLVNDIIRDAIARKDKGLDPSKKSQ
jgi:MoxR-like ATPase